VDIAINVSYVHRHCGLVKRRKSWHIDLRSWFRSSQSTDDADFVTVSFDESFWRKWKRTRCHHNN